MKYGKQIKKLNKWANKIVHGQWRRRLQIVYDNYFYWYDKLPFVLRPVAGAKVTKKYLYEIKKILLNMR